MAWVYCRKCGQEMDEPTDRQVLMGGYECPSCGVENDPMKSVNDVILGMLERLEHLEAEHGIHT